MAETDFSLVDDRGRKHLTLQERTRFLNAVRGDPRPEVQTFALTLVHTGCRISEALALRPDDVDLEAVDLRTRRPHWALAPPQGGDPSILVYWISKKLESRQGNQKKVFQEGMRPLWNTKDRYIHNISSRLISYRFGTTMARLDVPLDFGAKILTLI